MSTLFVSYSRNDSSITYSLADQLRECGFEVWTDVTGIVGGAVWEIEIEKAIQSSDALIILVSSASKSSQWVRKEILFALNLKKLVVPLLIENVPLPLCLNDIQAVEYKNNDIKPLLKAIHIQSLTTKPNVLTALDRKSTPLQPTSTNTSMACFRRLLVTRMREE
jgi:hypothetical protein